MNRVLFAHSRAGYFWTSIDADLRRLNAVTQHLNEGQWLGSSDSCGPFQASFPQIFSLRAAARMKHFVLLHRYIGACYTRLHNPHISESQKSSPYVFFISECSYPAHTRKFSFLSTSRYIATQRAFGVTSISTFWLFTDLDTGIGS